MPPGWMDTQALTYVSTGFTIHPGSALHRGKGSYTVEIELLIRKGNSMHIYRIIAFLKYKIFQTLI